MSAPETRATVTQEMLEAGLAARDQAMIEDCNDPIGAFYTGALVVANAVTNARVSEALKMVEDYHAAHIAERSRAQAAEAREQRLREALEALVEAYIDNVDAYRLGGFYTDPETEVEVIEARAALSDAGGE